MNGSRFPVRGFLIAAVVWLLYTFSYAILVMQEARIPFVWAFSGQVLSSAVPALFSLPVWWLMFRGLEERGWGVKIPLHLVIAPFYGWGATYVQIALTGAVFGSDASGPMASREKWIIFNNVIIYMVQFAIYHTVRIVQRLRLKEQHEAELRALASEGRLAALKSQLNPHFLFNTLNSISYMAGRDAEETRRMIADLGELLRYSIDGTRRNLAPLGDELHFLKSYVALEQRRFGGRLTVRYDVDETLLDTPVPVMLLQPLVENAVRHGIAPCEEGGTVSVGIARDGASMMVEVSDDGTGANVEHPEELFESDGVGLGNLRRRLRTIYGEGIGLDIRTAPGTGFTVRFSLPLNPPAAIEHYREEL